MATSKVIIEGIPGANGEYEISQLTNRDLHQIKQISGVRLGEFKEAAEAGDNDFVVAFAAVALRQNGKEVPLDALWDAPVGAKVTLAIGDEDEERAVEGTDAGPPSQKPTEPEGPETLRAVSGTTGNGGSPDGESLASIRLATGSQPSESTSDSDPATSAI